MAEFIYQMYQARKAHGDKVILDDVTLSFYPGAKIGVVGPNGMGKSTLLKIMAGIEEVSNGDARLTPGYTVGILQQEPPLDDDKTVIENVRMAFGDMIAKVDRFNKIGEEMCDPDCDMDALMAEMGKLQDEIDAADGWDIDSKLGQAMDALQLPDSDMPVNVLSGGERRRAPVRGNLRRQARHHHEVRYDIGDAQSDQRNPHARRYPRGVNALVFVIHPYHLPCL